MNKSKIFLAGVVVTLLAGVVSFLSFDHLRVPAESNFAFVSQFKTKPCYMYSDLELLEVEKAQITEDTTKYTNDLNQLLSRDRKVIAEQLASKRAELKTLEAQLQPSSLSSRQISSSVRPPTGQNIRTTIGSNTNQNTVLTSADTVSLQAQQQEKLRVDISRLKFEINLLTPTGIAAQTGALRDELSSLKRASTKNARDIKTATAKLCPVQEIETMTLNPVDFVLPNQSCYTNANIDLYTNRLATLKSVIKYAPKIIQTRNDELAKTNNTIETQQKSLDALIAKPRKTSADNRRISTLTTQITGLRDSVAKINQSLSRLNQNLDIAYQNSTLLDSSLNVARTSICADGVNPTGNGSGVINPPVKPPTIPECGLDESDQAIEPYQCDNGEYVCGGSYNCNTDSPGGGSDQCEVVGWRFEIGGFKIAGSESEVQAACNLERSICRGGYTYVEVEDTRTAYERSQNPGPTYACRAILPPDQRECDAKVVRCR